MAIVHEFLSSKAFFLSVISFFVPVIPFAIMDIFGERNHGSPMWFVAATIPLFFIAYALMEIAALVLGIRLWAGYPGRAAVGVSSIGLVVFAVVAARYTRQINPRR